jgi:hypothetical protein
MKTILVLIILQIALVSVYAQREVQLDTNVVTSNHAVIRVKTIEVSETVTVWTPSPSNGWIMITQKFYESAGWHQINLNVKRGWNDFTVCMESGIEQKLRIFRY